MTSAQDIIEATTPKSKTISEEYSTWVLLSSWYHAANMGDFYEYSYLMSGFAGECGEAVDEWKKIQRKINPYADGINQNTHDAIQQRLGSLVDEVGDVLWYMQAICNMWCISLEDLMLLNAAKLQLKHSSDRRMPAWPFKEPPEEVRERLFKYISTVITERLK